MKSLFITTTESIEGYKITQTFDLLFANVVVGTGMLSEFFASFTDLVGGRSKVFQNRMNELYDNAKNDLQEKASSIGANAIVGFRINLSEISGKGVSMFMLTAFGTAVYIEPIEADRYQRYEKLLQLKQFFEAGVISKDEYDYESKQIQTSCKNAISSDLKVEMEKEQRKREMDEFYRQMEEERLRHEAAEDERRRQLSAEREATRNLIAGGSERLSKGIHEVIDEGQAKLKMEMTVPSWVDSTSVPSDLQALLNTITICPETNMFDIICDYLMDNEFSTACAYYLKSTGSDDYDAAREYVLGVKSLYEGMTTEKLIEKLTTRSIDVYKSTDVSKTYRVLSRYLSANDTVINYLISTLIH